MYKKTIIPRQQQTYSSFPTFITHGDDLYLFYRQGKTDKTFVHGYKGIVNCWKISKKRLIDAFNSDQSIIFDKGLHTTIFENRELNELDSIVSKLDDNFYSLVTRMYLPRKLNQPYISFSSTPNFKERKKIKVPGTQWLVLYGKGLKTNEGYVFPAYGSLKKEPGERVILIQTDDLGDSWSILSYLPLNRKEYILNESSIVYDGKQYSIFMRSNKLPFAIWYSQSKDLKEWTTPQKLVDKGHAPMAIMQNERMIMSYRDLSIKNQHATSIMNPFTDESITRLDTYIGNLYDGGYSDLGIIDNHLFVTYYSGNQMAEPYIKGTLIPL